ncbi:MAG: leucine-rich repeat domain-containing protein [Treponemataceae bacterium]|nr:leucine-rich repeat domain-containing protein [Treponemataceae bacterium]
MKTILVSVKSIGDNAFSSCRSLATVNYEGTEAQWNEISMSYTGLRGKTITGSDGSKWRAK